MVKSKCRLVGTEDSEERQRIHLRDPRDDNGGPGDRMVRVLSTVRSTDGLPVPTNFGYRVDQPLSSA